MPDQFQVVRDDERGVIQIQNLATGDIISAGRGKAGGISIIISVPDSGDSESGVCDLCLVYLPPEQAAEFADWMMKVTNKDRMGALDL